jgi:uncharacterized protein YlxP (DUF503 family)
MFVGVIHLKLLIPASNSLKDRRQVVASIKGKLHSRFNISVAEIESSDHWREASFGMAMVNDSRSYLEGEIAAVLRFVEENYPVEILALEKEII